MATQVDRAKATQNFQGAMTRPACRNCQQGLEQLGSNGAPTWQCRLGSFQTTAMAVCERHQIKTASTYGSRK